MPFLPRAVNDDVARRQRHPGPWSALESTKIHRLAPMTSERVFLIDGTAIAYRSHFAFIRSPLFDEQGRNTSAVYGFVATLIKLLREEKPDRIAIAFDSPEPTFRHERYKDYKATREKMPDELVDQLPLIRKVAEAMGIPFVRKPGFEADDIIGTLAREGEEAGHEVFLVSGDKDFMQLVGPRISVYDTTKPGEAVRILDPSGVEEVWGVGPDRVVDFLGLMGDSSDNVPGVPGVGKKTALKLLLEHGTLEEVLAAAPDIKAKRLRENLIEFADQARLSRELVTIDCHVSLETSIDDLRFGERDDETLSKMFSEMAFHRFQEDLGLSGVSGKRIYRTVRNGSDLNELIEALEAAEVIAVDTETTSLDARQADLVGLSFSVEDEVAWYVPVNLDPPILSDGEGTPTQRVLDRLRPVLTAKASRLSGQNIKYDMVVLRRAGLDLTAPWFDTMVASFTLDPGTRAHNLDALALRHFRLRKIPTSDLIGKGKKQISMADVPVDVVGEYAAEDADVTYRLTRMFEPRLAEEESLSSLFHGVEMPLVPVLTDMEWQGVKIDVECFAAMSERFGIRIGELEAEIHEIAGEPFNIGSPKQLGEVLFEKLRVQDDPAIDLKRPRKTKTGWSTDQRTLEQIAAHPLAARILEYRSLSKLKGTYVDTLPLLVNPETGRIHTSYNQTGAITGRLSSSDPNLQNIPVRTPEGREIRQAFVPRKDGWKLLSADYSQIELRILAHLSGDERLIEAFASGEDIHSATAALIFGADPENVDRDMRSRAKAINFGIIYGMGPQRLAADTHISMIEARAFIGNYFENYPGVREFQAESKRRALEDGYVTTLLGRRRPIPEMGSSDRRLRVTAENMAINTPIQGTAADLIKIAMVKLHGRIAAEGLEGKMILQVHDELVFDVPEAEVETFTTLAREEMSQALELNVPIVVDVGVGDDWLAAH
jgi:DNA polymerase I